MRMAVAEMSPEDRQAIAGDPWPHAVVRHAFAWLVLANCTGVLMSVLLVRPELGEILSPLSYGRWMPVHANAQLYGWCSLPLIGVLYGWYRPGGQQTGLDQAFRAVLGVWSLALALGVLSWLGGLNSGKLFLEWRGLARLPLPLAMSCLWAVLARATWLRRGQDGATWRVLGMATLLPVPALMLWATSRHSFPPVNPDSGGATGSSLLGSTLGIVAIFALLPPMLRLPETRPAWRTRSLCWVTLLASLLVYAAAGHGHLSHHDPAQIASLATLLLWIPLGCAYYRTFSWSGAARPWLVGAALWWAVLVGSGLITFLPGMSERLKFTHGLVAHAHAAMAGFLTCMLIALLSQLTYRKLGGSLAWQALNGVHVFVLSVLGWTESEGGALFRGELWTRDLLILRLGVGIGMLALSVVWFTRGWKIAEPEAVCAGEQPVASAP